MGWMKWDGMGWMGGWVGEKEAARVGGGGHCCIMILFVFPVM